jgi:hypothetical protein
MDRLEAAKAVLERDLAVINRGIETEDAPDIYDIEALALADIVLWSSKR